MTNTIKENFQKITSEIGKRWQRWWDNVFFAFFLLILLKTIFNIFTHSATPTTYFLCILVILVEIYSKICTITNYLYKTHTTILSVLNLVNEEMQVKKDEI